MRTNECVGPVFDGGVGGGAGSYTPAVPSNWLPAPTTVGGALDQIAARKRSFDAPGEVLASITLYVRTTGNDDTGVPGNVALPFATLQGAMRAVPEATKLGGDPNFGAVVGATIDVGAGTFELPSMLPHWAGVVAVNTSVSVSLTRNVAAIVWATPTDGNVVSLDGAAIGAGSLRNRVVEFLTAGLVHIAYGTIYENIAGNVIYYETDDTTAINPAIPVGAVVRILAQDTIFVQTTNFSTVFHGGDAAGALTWTGGDFTACSLELSGGFNINFVRAIGLFVQFASAGLSIFNTCAIALINTGNGGEVRIQAGCTVDGSGGNTVQVFGGGLVLFFGCNSFARCAAAIEGRSDGSTTVIIGSANVLRFNDCTSCFRANRAAGIGSGSGGSYELPRLHTATGITGVTSRMVIARSFARISIAASTSVIIGGITNPVSADDNSTQSAYNQDGTYITGGNPSPGPMGPGNQVVVATAQTWDKVSSMVVLDSSAMGVGSTFILPAINSVTAGVSDSVSVTLKNEDGTNAVIVNPTGADTIDGLATLTPVLGGVGVMASVRLTVRRSTTNWMVN